ncbi:hypothetical protein ACIO3O_26650 [Streptomyces sp. NPDC087440]|uniref:hypothetical protein n=1 Tax=Streptomyces sp. NPDC087440 TaxID=3365790 RepID=UPI0037FBE967
MLSVAPLSRLLAVLVMAVGLLCGPALAAQGAEARAAASVAFEVQDDTPGCEPAPSHGTGQPASPPRGSTSYELMPVLFQVPGTHDTAGLDRLVVSPAPGRAPPPATPPTPVDLGVLLRV